MASRLLIVCMVLGMCVDRTNPDTDRGSTLTQIHRVNRFTVSHSVVLVTVYVCAMVESHCRLIRLFH